MQILKTLFNSPKETVFAISGLTLVGVYLFYARKHVLGNQKKCFKSEL